MRYQGGLARPQQAKKRSVLFSVRWVSERIENAAGCVCMIQLSHLLCSKPTTHNDEARDVYCKTILGQNNFLGNSERMRIADKGRKSRASRVREGVSGSWGTSSQDFVYLAKLLYGHSAKYAKRFDGNCSAYTPAGIPILLSALRCLLIELNADIYHTGRANQDVLEELAKSANDIEVIFKHYSIPTELHDRLELLVQVRHEILHPAHRPSGDVRNTPAYLAPLRRAKLLQSTGVKNDYIWLDQLRSHRLFSWGFNTVKQTVAILHKAHQLPPFEASKLLASYSTKRQK